MAERTPAHGADRGYDFVPLPDRIERRTRPEAVHDRRMEGTWTGHIDVIFALEQPVHIGSGYKGIIDDQVVRLGVAIDGRPGVPGSSIKGMLRSRFEAITRSCILEKPPHADNVKSRSRPDITWVEFATAIPRLPVFQAGCQPQGALCPACALFGRMSLRSRVQGMDFVALDRTDWILAEMPAQFGPRLHHLGPFDVKHDARRARDYFAVEQLHGRKFGRGHGPRALEMQPVAVIPAGSQLGGRLRVANVTSIELGGLLTALGYLPESRLKLGAGKGLGFGRIRVLAPQVTLTDCRHQPVALDLHALRSAFVGSSDRLEAGEHTLVAIHHKDC